MVEEPHVKAWWDHDIHWTLKLIQKKYQSYVKGYKLKNGEAKAIRAFIIWVDDVPIGFIQIYNAYHFSRSIPLVGLPSSLAAFDLFIGEKQYLNKGIGHQVIDQFLKDYAKPYSHVFTDPVCTNIAAIRAYEKAGFNKANEQPDTAVVWLIREQFLRQSEELLKLIQHLELSLLDPPIRQSKNALNKLIADDFVEFGKSGKIYNKQNILDALPTEKPKIFNMIDFEIRELSQDIVLARYKTIENGVVSLRSSIWQKVGDPSWQLLFHQGTKVL